MMTAPTFQIQMLPRAAVPTQQFRPRSRSFPFPCNHSIRKCAAKKVSAVASDADEILTYFIKGMERILIEMNVPAKDFID